MSSTYASRVLEPLLTVKEVAMLLRVSNSWVYDRATRDLRSVYVGGLLRFERSPGMAPPVAPAWAERLPPPQKQPGRVRNMAFVLQKKMRGERCGELARQVAPAELSWSARLPPAQRLGFQVSGVAGVLGI
jgi:hypothetical protein